MSLNQREKQIAEAEELLGERLEKVGFAKGLFFGRYLADRLPAYPNLTGDDEANRAVDALAQFCAEEVDPAAIDFQEDIPRAVIDGLGRLGVLGACLPSEVGGRGLSQSSYCRLLEVLGGHCASTALFVNAHHSIGPRALVLFGTAEQQQRWLPKLASGEAISAFALTEPEAGSDAANVQTTATPMPDGSGYKLTGEKQWITNGSIADVLTVMARTPVDPSKPDGESRITAFVVTPDMTGFEVVEARMSKCGVRGTATARLRFREMIVPRENVLGELGKGLKVALTVLDYGRTTFGASCTGAAKFCVDRAIEHANRRVQFGQTLGSFELVQEKLASMAAATLAMEAATYQTAALIDTGAEDYMLETAMLKVFATDRLWQIVHDTIQIFGGKAYFTDEPYERMMRDARINLIGEGANDVLRVFTALVGMRDVGLELKGIAESLSSPLRNLGTLGEFASRRLGALFMPPEVPVRCSELEADAQRLGKLVGSLGTNVTRLLGRYRESIVDRQHQLARISDCVTELYVGSCLLARLDTALHGAAPNEDHRRDLAVARHYLATCSRRVRRNLADLWDNDDESTTATAALLLKRGG